MNIPPLVRPQTWPCHCCVFVGSAMTDRGLVDAMNEHRDFVNATKDRATDPHFEDVRRDALLADAR